MAAAYFCGRTPSLYALGRDAAAVGPNSAGLDPRASGETTGIAAAEATAPDLNAA